MGRIPYRCAAVIAAYAIALQALLSAFAIVPPLALASDPAFAICQSGGADPASQHPYDPCAACLAHCAGAAAGPQRVVAFLPWPREIVAATTVRAAALPPARAERQHAPRAPPLG